MASEVNWKKRFMEAEYTCNCGSDTLLCVRSSEKVYIRVLPGFEYPKVIFTWRDDDIRVNTTYTCGDDDIRVNTTYTCGATFVFVSNVFDDSIHIRQQ
ncbi:hypothetical protein DY000_02063661 [Brassica cretica]|uniref:S-protein homolog n=1 Tax=Brassica cretica TaxID=69181 RepID=A0ABQ7B1Q1_BRACR|nr:hypothetical protein DY000_02063661 [Brassica cretica]